MKTSDLRNCPKTSKRNFSIVEGFPDLKTNFFMLSMMNKLIIKFQIMAVKMKILKKLPEQKQDHMHNIRNDICIKVINSDIRSQKILHYCREMPSNSQGKGFF